MHYAAALLVLLIPLFVRETEGVTFEFTPLGLMLFVFITQTVFLILAEVRNHLRDIYWRS